MSITAAEIDLSRLPAPDVLEPVAYNTLLADARARFQSAWSKARTANPSLPDYDLTLLESDPASVILQAIAYVRMLDRIRVNDAARAVLLPFAAGADLDALASRLGITRLAGESDDRFRLRYLAAFDRPSAGSEGKYLFEAYTAWPALHHAAVIGRAIHGRRGEVDIAICGPNGRPPTDAELALVRNAVTAPNVKPEATAVRVGAARRTLYAFEAKLTIARGPDPEIVKREAEARIIAAAAERMLIGSEVPVEVLTGAAYGTSILRVDATLPTRDVPANPYRVPVLAGIRLSVEVRA